MRMMCRDLGWGVRNKQIVEGIDLDVHPGETLGLIGPNGSGKSTLLRMLAGITKPTRGHIELEGQDMQRMAQRTIAQHLAFVEQHADTGERITVRDAVELGRTPWLSALRGWSEEDDSVVSKALADVGLVDFDKRQWATLSGGERQRVHIARGLAQQPRMLLLDEPTNHLDIRHQMSILKLVIGLEITSIIALHDLNQALLCDRICVLQDGRAVAIGDPKEVITPEFLAENFSVEARFLKDPEDGETVIHFCGALA
ncbi:MAG: ABC transporter ATP-binding protein [Pseudomonadota bacterium]